MTLEKASLYVERVENQVKSILLELEDADLQKIERLKTTFLLNLVQLKEIKSLLLNKRFKKLASRIEKVILSVKDVL